MKRSMMIKKKDSGGVDEHTMLMLHFDGSTEDSSKYQRTPLRSNGIYYVSGKFSQGFYIASNSSAISYSPDFFKNVINSKSYTIDLWLKLSSKSQWGFILGVDDGTTKGFVLRYNGDNSNRGIEYGLLTTYAGSIFNKISFPIDGQFHHLAISCDKVTTRLFIDGIISGTVGSPSIVFPNSRFTVGGREVITGEESNSIIDELRISNIARWTSNFPPPTKPYN